MVRGQGKTEGYHERRIPVRHKFSSAMLQRNAADLSDAASISQARIQDVGKVQRILSHAIQTFVNRGDSANTKPEQRERAREWLDRLDEIVDATFFDDLQAEFEKRMPLSVQPSATVGCGTTTNDSGVIDHARSLLYDAEDALPCPAIHYYKAREAAEGLFEGRLRGASGFLGTCLQTPNRRVRRDHQGNDRCPRLGNTVRGFPALAGTGCPNGRITLRNSPSTSGAISPNCAAWTLTSPTRRPFGA